MLASWADWAVACLRAAWACAAAWAAARSAWPAAAASRSSLAWVAEMAADSAVVSTPTELRAMAFDRRV